MQSDIRPIGLEVFVTLVRPRISPGSVSATMPEIPLAHVRVEVENLDGQKAQGWGAALLNDMWTWQDPQVRQPLKHHAMIRLVDEWGRRVMEYSAHAHPMDIWWDMHQELPEAAQTLSDNLHLPGTMPYLASLACAAPVDAALHDAFGKVNGINSYNGYGRTYMQHDLSYYFGKRFRGSYVGDILQPMPARIDAFHLVGETDKLTEGEINDDDPKDGWPVALDQWIRHDYLHNLKINLRGTDLAWDVQRLIDVTRIARQEQARLGLHELWLSVDANEQCEQPEYIVEMLHKVREYDAGAYEAILYVEQPCPRDLRAHPLNVSRVAEHKPVVVDESLTDWRDLDLALELGYSGEVLKTCTGHSSSLLTAVQCAHREIAYTVQDLATPGIALAQSVGLAAHLRPIKGIEAGSRQFFPKANEPLARVHPGVTKLQDGRFDTTTLGGVGLGYQWERLDMQLEAGTH